ARLEALGCDPAEEVRAGLSPIDVALRHRANASARWLLDRNVPVGNTLQVAAYAVNLDLARELLGRGAVVNTCAVTRALDNEDVEVVRLLAARAPADEALGGLAMRARTLAANTTDTHRSAVLTDLANRFSVIKGPLKQF